MHRKILIPILLVLFAGTAAGSNLTVEVQDTDGRLDAQLTVEQDGTEVASSSGFLEANLNDGENYTLIQQLDNGPDVTVHNFSITQDFDYRPRIYRNENPEENFLTDTDPLYYTDQSFDFSKAEFEVSRNEPDSISRCTSIQNGDCSSWEVQDTSQFETSYSGSTFSYNITQFSGYTSGVEAPLPQIENIQIYNVSGVQDQENDGTLVDEGLNKTFQINQSNPNEYRFSFNVSNQGSDSWILTTDDTLEHRTLNQSWSINESEDIFYNVNGTTYTGGTFSSGAVGWSTGNGGEVPVNDSMTAQYIVNISQDSTNTFNQVLNASTSSDTSDEDHHELKTLIYGFIDPDIDSPSNNSVVQNNRIFNLNGTINCIDGDCGDIRAEPRRNESTDQEPFTGSEFEVIDQNSTCSNLLEGQSCAVEWDVNATGDQNTFHALDFSASSSYSGVESNNTQDNIIEIRDILMIDIDWNVVDFGVLDPGEKQNPAENNSEGYNLTVEEDSNTVDNLWFKASPLVSEKDSNYTIDPVNMNLSENSDGSNPKNFTTSYSLLDSNLRPGTTKNLYYWLNVPYGIINGGYTGTMTFKANRTQ
ncbi:hypothetical protein [Candidatus Nanohalobium constans]|uniref:Uncharacterized protein n=1 Tax=Candidatus Nanohalobium constans TaxID=2565781 RepID=A0A5Q0UEY5_9ARCH|nr:hypothetical protein [Candidatus Nanohalobium constans]QGA80117.1 hypothetical protein LC1Nh_0213 [Candidatus Nanohalobium constans]